MSVPRRLVVVDGTFAVCRLDVGSAIPPWAMNGQLWSVTRTAEELSVVCDVAAVPADAVCEGGWRCLRVAGSIPFSAVGVLASLTAPLAAAGISVFAVSTFNTDYMLIKKQDLEHALSVLRAAGYTVE